MALEMIGYLSYKDGELDLDTAVADDYVGGQPICVTTNGKLALNKSAAAALFVGLARNDKSVDAANGKVTYIAPGSQVVIRYSLAADGVTKVYPYAEAFSAYAPGDILYSSAAGKWTRTSPGAGSRGMLVVLKKDADEGLRVVVREGATVA